MRKILILILTSFIALGATFAEQSINLGEFLTQYFEYVSKDIPQSYKYINIKYTNIDKSSALYQALQKGVYLDLFPNNSTQLPTNLILTQEQGAKLIEKTSGIKIRYKTNQRTTDVRLKSTLTQIAQSIQAEDNMERIEIEFNMQEKVMQDVYKTLTTDYIDSSKLDSQKLEYGAIRGMTEAIGDKYTVFFAPEEAKDFNESIQGEYEGIGAQVDIPQAGKLVIVAPLKDSPAQRANLMGGDIIKKIDGKDITKDITLDGAIKMIKGPAGTDVALTIERNGVIIEKTITRAKIIMEEISLSDDMPYGTCYIGISEFNNDVYDKFTQALNSFNGKVCHKYIFDLRNNPGGLLDQVQLMLNYFVPTGETSIIIKSKEGNEIMIADKVEGKKLTDKNIVVLINELSASASEIFAGVIKDYCPNSVLIGKKSYGKGSVQEVVPYLDGSTLKYTKAKRYMGKSEININEIGIIPDLEIEDNQETKIDEQLEAAKNYISK